MIYDATETVTVRYKIEAESIDDAEAKIMDLVSLHVFDRVSGAVMAACPGAMDGRHTWPAWLKHCTIGGKGDYEREVKPVHTQ